MNHKKIKLDAAAEQVGIGFFLEFFELKTLTALCVFIALNRIIGFRMALVSVGSVETLCREPLESSKCISRKMN